MHDRPLALPSRRRYLGFEPLTLIPIQAKLIDADLLSAKEVAYLDAYHAKVWDRVSPLLNQAEDAHSWLYSSTRPLHEQSSFGAASPGGTARKQSVPASASSP